jgi:hypothetical protein
MKRQPKIYVWKNDNKMPKFEDITSIDKMDFSAWQNAKNMATVLMEHMPGNSNDLLFSRIEFEIKNVLSLPDGKDLLMQDYDIASRIRSALCDIMNEE